MEQVGRPQAAYNPAVHGPYNPGTWYGKRKCIGLYVRNHWLQTNTGGSYMYWTYASSSSSTITSIISIILVLVNK